MHNRLLTLLPLLLLPLLLLPFLLAGTLVHSENKVTRQVAAPTSSGMPVITVNSQLVVLDVYVSDKQGKVVTDLHPDDFQIYEDKQLQTIRNFDPPGAHAVPANVVINSTQDLDRLAPDAPTTIILLNDYSMGKQYAEDEWKAKAAAWVSLLEYLKRQPARLTQPTMVLSVNTENTIVVHDYTQDRDAVLAAVRHYQQENRPTDSVAKQAAGIHAVAQMAQATSGHPGHKNVVWFGTAISASPRDIADLIASRVSIYLVDPSGIGFTPDPEKQHNISNAAWATGGGVFAGTNDTEGMISSAVHDGNAMYSISYVPNTGNMDSKSFRNIKIVMKDPKLYATTRLGYYPDSTPRPAQPMIETRIGNSNHVVTRVPSDLRFADDTKLVYDGIPVSILDGATPLDKYIHIDGQPVIGANRKAAKIDVISTTFDKNDKALKHGTGSYSISVPEESQSMADANFDINIPLKLLPDPRAVRLRIVVRAIDNGKVGATNLELTTTQVQPVR